MNGTVTVRARATVTSRVRVRVTSRVRVRGTSRVRVTLVSTVRVVSRIQLEGCLTLFNLYLTYHRQGFRIRARVRISVSVRVSVRARIKDECWPLPGSCPRPVRRPEHPRWPPTCPPPEMPISREDFGAAACRKVMHLGLGSGLDMPIGSERAHQGADLGQCQNVGPP